MVTNDDFSLNKGANPGANEHKTYSTNSTEAPFTQKCFSLKTQTFLYKYKFCLHKKVEKTHKTHENVFTSKKLSKVETLKTETKEMQCKCCVNSENVNAENANAENVHVHVLYQV